jgi:hypothetical protein
MVAMNARKLKLAVSVFAVATLIAAAFLILPANSQVTGLVVHIRSDGSVDPASVPIQVSGNTYVLTGDFSTQGIVIEKEGITIDGAGHTMMGPYNGSQTLWIIGEGPNQTIPANQTEIWSIGIDTATNAIGDLTIRNLNLQNFSIGMYLWTPNNTVTGNAIVDGIVGILVSGDNNTISGNYLARNKNGVFFGSNLPGNIPTGLKISGNRFVDNIRQLSGCVCVDYNITEIKHTWDDGKKGNFWSDYNGTDSNGDGIGDTPYVIDALNLDRYPLVTSSVTPPTVTADIHVELTIAASVLIVVVIVAAVVFRRRKKKETPDAL